MKVDEFRKTWICNIPLAELEEYQHAVDVQGDRLLVIYDLAYSLSDIEMDDHKSLHYSGRGDLDDFWNTLLKVNPLQKPTPKEKKRTTRKPRKSTTTKKKVTKKKAIPKKVVTKKATPKKKVTTKKRAPRKKVAAKKGDLLAF